MKKARNDVEARVEAQDELLRKLSAALPEGFSAAWTAASHDPDRASVKVKREGFPKLLVLQIRTKARRGREVEGRYVFADRSYKLPASVASALVARFDEIASTQEMLKDIASDFRPD